MIGRKGRDLVSIPLPQLDVPHFRYGKKRLRRRRAGRRRSRAAHRRGRRNGERHGQAGSDPGAHILEVEVSLEELAAILGDELELPRIEPKGKANIKQEKSRYTAFAAPAPSRCGTSSARTCKPCGGRFRRTTTIPTKPSIVPIRDDKRYRSWTDVQQPEANAVIIYMMDVSGSMTDEQKEIVRTEAFWLDTWLTSQYDGVEVRYIIHDAAAKEGRRGHVLSHPRKRRHADQLGLQSCRRFDSHRVLRQRVEHLLLPVLRRRQLGRRQRTEPAAIARRTCCRWSTCSATARSKAPTAAASTSARCKGRFGEKHEKLVLSEIENKEAIYDSIKAFLGKGK